MAGVISRIADQWRKGLFPQEAALPHLLNKEVILWIDALLAVSPNLRYEHPQLLPEDFNSAGLGQGLGICMFTKCPRWFFWVWGWHSPLHLRSSQSRFRSEKKVLVLEAAAITLPFQTDLFVSLLRVISLVVRIKSWIFTFNVQI